MIVVAAGLRPEVRGVPRYKKKRSLVFGWNEAVLSLSSLAQSRDFGINVALKFQISALGNSRMACISLFS
jgi:hypothetical protein